MKNRIAALICGVACVLCSTVSASACDVPGCQNLILSSTCSPDFANESEWTVFNPNTAATTASPADNFCGGVSCDGLCYAWTLNNSSFEETGLCIAPQATVTFTTPVAGDNTVTIYVDGDAQVGNPVSRSLQCDCNGTPGGTAVLDGCGVCGGDNSNVGCDGVCNSGKTDDSCGVCGGNNSEKGCDGVCNSDKTVDACGQCGGDGSECACTQKVASQSVKKSANKVISATKALYHRIPEFAKRAVQCKSSDKSKVPGWESVGLSLEQQITHALSINITNTVEECPGVQCVQVSTSGVTKSLTKLVNKLAKLAKTVKIRAGQDCNVAIHTGPDNPNAKDTTFYQTQVLSAIKNLPKASTQCTGKPT